MSKFAKYAVSAVGAFLAMYVAAYVALVATEIILTAIGSPNEGDRALPFFGAFGAATNGGGSEWLFLLGAIIAAGIGARLILVATEVFGLIIERTEIKEFVKKAMDFAPYFFILFFSFHYTPLYDLVGLQAGSGGGTLKIFFKWVIIFSCLVSCVHIAYIFLAQTYYGKSVPLYVAIKRALDTFLDWLFKKPSK
jgi:hypothetical protein